MIRKFLSTLPSSHVKLTERGSAAIIQINRPEALNAFSISMLKNLHDAIKELEQRKSVVMIKGVEKIYSVGGDVKVLMNLSIEDAKFSYENSYRTFDRVANYKIPFVALVDGLAMGAATSHTIAGKYRVATERALFAMPETAIGYFNDAGASYFLPRLKNNLGFYMGMTGARVTEYDMVKTNLSTHYVTSEKMSDLEGKLIDCKSHDDVSNVLKKFSTVPKSTETELDSILPRIEKCFGSPTVEEIYENLERDGSEWAKKTIKTLNRMSPTSLKVTHKCMSMGKNLSLRDCLKLELNIVLRYMIKSDLKEGVRALLVEKDFKPKWNPPTLAEVTKEHVDNFFKPLPANLTLTF